MSRRVLLAIVLVAAVLMQVACAKGTPSVSTAPFAGKRLCITSPVTIEILNVFYDDMRAAAKDSGSGLQFVVVDAKGDYARQLADVQQFIAGGDCACIATVTAVTPEIAEAWAKTMEDAKKKNIVVVNHSADWVTGATQNISNPHYPAGFVVGQEAGKWYKAHGSKGEAGTLDNPGSPGLLQRSQAFEDGFKSAAGDGVKFWHANCGNLTQDGAIATASLLQAHPDINVLFVWGGDGSVGATQSANEAGRTDPDKFFLGCVDANDDQIKAVGTGGTILQGVSIFPYPFSAVAQERAIEWAMLGEKVPPTGYVKAILLTKDNVADYLRASHHQFLPENAHYFDELMVYFDNSVKTGDPFPDQSTGYVWKGASTTPNKALVGKLAK